MGLVKDPPKPEKDERDYPGTTLPKNRDTKHRVQAVDVTSPVGLVEAAHSHEFLVEGVIQSFYTVGSLGAILSKSPVTIRSWEQKGWLPKARYRSPPPAREQIPGRVPLGKRLYTKEQVLCLVEAYHRYINTRTPDWVSFRKHIKDNYPS